MSASDPTAPSVGVASYRDPAGQGGNRWRRALEFGFWIVFFAVNNLANSVTVLMAARRDGLDIADWEPVVWEWSSGLSLLLLVPAVAAFSRRFPLHWETWRAHLPWHLLASVVFSLLHVGMMVAMRKAAYVAQGLHYDFGAWPVELVYEYLKDVRAYVMIVAIIEVYRFLRRRQQGEASLLALPDDGPPVEPVDRPSRFLVRKLGREFLVPAAEIEWVQSSANYVNLHVRGRDYPLRSTLSALETRLDPAFFVRIHRSYIVNLSQIAAIEALDDGDARVHLRDGATLPCSRRYREALRAAAGN
jgi:DNA-binding LytR/AlgR family response regulator